MLIKYHLTTEAVFIDGLKEQHQGGWARNPSIITMHLWSWGLHICTNTVKPWTMEGEPAVDITLFY